MYASLLKRLLDFSLSLILLMFAFPIVLLLIFVASIDTRSFGLFAHKRVGRHGKEFTLFKIKTMKNDKSGVRSSVTAACASSITTTGRYLRRYKLDELPQLFNVLVGDMSFVGPRPDTREFTSRLNECERVILTVRPGITGPASIKYRDEERLLLSVSNPIEYNDGVIWPDKVIINMHYVQNVNFFDDCKLIYMTIFGA